ncbi:MAG: hypothetical protein PHS57_06835 [Alphaproteobacteria bacterium]|nr:hypothetical protein [Alphaproteobacteria bacterium]
MSVFIEEERIIYMPKHYSIDQLSTETARRAQNEAAQLERRQKKLRDTIADTGLSITTPVVKTRRSHTKKTRSTLNLFGISLAEIFNLLSGEAGLSSVAQSASESLSLLSSGQRIR